MIQTHKKDLHAILSDVKTPEELHMAMRADKYLSEYMELAVDARFLTFDIEDSDLPKKINIHESMSGAFLSSKNSYQLVFDVILGQKAPKATRIKQLKSLYDMLSENEAKILMAILRKTLVDLYPILSHEFVCSAIDIKMSYQK